jgi:hypothetical protein
LEVFEDAQKKNRLVEPEAREDVILERLGSVRVGRFGGVG